MYHTQSPMQKSQPIHLTIFFFFQRGEKKNKLIDCCARARAQSTVQKKFKMKKNKRQNGRRRDSSSFNSDKKWRPSAERSRFPCLSHRLMDVLLERHGHDDGRPTLECIKQRNKTLSHTKIVQTRKEKQTIASSFRLMVQFFLEFSNSPRFFFFYRVDPQHALSIKDLFFNSNKLKLRPFVLVYTHRKK